MQNTALNYLGDMKKVKRETEMREKGEEGGSLSIGVFSSCKKEYAVNKVLIAAAANTDWMFTMYQALFKVF